MTVRAEAGTYSGLGSCVRIANDIVELYVTTDVGPRIIHYGLLDGPNVMFVNSERINIKKGAAFDRVFYPGAYWDIYGGTRLWVAPESMPETFYPDHEPLAVEPLAGGAVFRAPAQRHNGLVLSMTVMLAERSSQVTLRYAVTNAGSAPQTLAPWAVTAVAAGGLLVIPQPRAATGVLPNRRIALWPYSNMRDERVHWGQDYITLEQRPDASTEFKFGINNVDGWACYVNRGCCFLLRYAHDPAGSYADFGASYESYVNPWYLEMESMAPLNELSPGAVASHTETWELFSVDTAPRAGDESTITSFVDRFGLNSPSRQVRRPNAHLPATFLRYG